MSKGAGAIERAIIDAFRDEDRVWTAAELAACVYKTKHPRRAHKLAVKRAVKSAIRRITADRDKYAELYQQATHDTEAQFGKCPKGWSAAVEQWDALLHAHPDYIAFKQAARRREPVAHMLAWRSTIRADGTGLFHHRGRPVRIWAVSIDPLGPTFHEAQIEEITERRVSVRYSGVRCPLDREQLNSWGCYWRGVLFVSARDGHIAAKLWERWAAKYASDWEAWTRERIAHDLPHMRLGEARGLLGVAEGYDRADVMRAFRRLAHKHHPDHGGDARAFRQLVEARDLLLAFIGEKAKPVEIPKAPRFVPSGVAIRYSTIRRLPHREPPRLTSQVGRLPAR